MTGILEKPDQIDWNALEAQIHDGHVIGGDNSNGRDPGGGDDGRWHEPELSDGVPGAAIGAALGFVPGFFAGASASSKYESHRIKNYFHSQGLAVPPANSNAYIGVYEKPTHNFTEVALFLGPITLAVAISAATGHKIQKIVEKRRQS